MQAGTDLPIWSINAPGWLRGVDFSDHASYWKEGIPAFMLTDTAFYRNPLYHTEKDLPESLDYQKMSDVVQGLLALLISPPKTQ